MSRMETSDRCRCDEDRRHDQLQPHGPDEGDEQIAGRQRDGGRDDANEDSAGDAGARAVRPSSGRRADEGRQGEDGQCEQQLAKQADRCEGCKYCEDDHGGGLRKDKI